METKNTLPGGGGTCAARGRPDPARGQPDAARCRIGAACGPAPCSRSRAPPPRRRRRAIALWLAALCGVLLSCPNPVLVPDADVAIVSARGVKADGGSCVRITLRVSARGKLSLERFGITVKAASDLRDYWHTDVVVEEVPAGASVILETALDFDTAEESYVEGSAVVEAAWFE